MMDNENGAVDEGTGNETGDGGDVLAELPPQTREVVGRVREMVSARPLAAAGIATGIGYVLGGGLPRPRVLMVGAALGYGLFRLLRYRSAGDEGANEGAMDEGGATGDEGSEGEDDEDDTAAVGTNGDTPPARSKKRRRHKPARARRTVTTTDA